MLSQTDVICDKDPGITLLYPHIHNAPFFKPCRPNAGAKQLELLIVHLLAERPTAISNDVEQ